ncbi:MULTISPECIES: hypothetical protein [unclassified Massilia]|uniref:hypothetical protein n=1 Tax=unclassified Massilia TaxID=2609279 RepID=UPI001786FEEC|nr:MULTISPECIES: hypothetical protein [unclassified Massilia]MBD8531515.1 hypothetical protein [Massilia sp. CFBP 13647]MBD8673689.1 hypothetical protein [Massilia sp. CFBP 13721]
MNDNQQRRQKRGDRPEPGSLKWDEGARGAAEAAPPASTDAELKTDDFMVYDRAGNRRVDLEAKLRDAMSGAATSGDATADLRKLLIEARAVLETWKDAVPAVSLCADIDKALAASAPDWISYDERSDTLTIHGIKYAGELMRDFGRHMPQGQLFELVARQADGALCVKRIERAAAPADIGPRWDDNGEPWNEAAEKIDRDHAAAPVASGIKECTHDAGCEFCNWCGFRAASPATASGDELLALRDQIGQAIADYAAEHMNPGGQVGIDWCSATDIDPLADRIIALLPVSAATKPKSELRIAIRQMATALNNDKWDGILTADGDLDMLGSEISLLMDRLSDAATKPTADLSKHNGLKRFGMHMTADGNFFGAMPDGPYVELADVLSLLATKPAAPALPLNSIPATMRHDEGAIACCAYCGRYSLDPATLSSRQPLCECGKQHGWSGSFKKPGPDARWSGKGPASPMASADAATVKSMASMLANREWAEDLGLTGDLADLQGQITELVGRANSGSSADAVIEALTEAENIARCHDLGTPDGHTIADAIAALRNKAAGAEGAE